MAAGRIVLEIKNISDLVQYVLNHHAPPSTLVVCSSKVAFLQALQAPEVATAEATATLESISQRPTLRSLSTSRSLKLVFCSDIMHLRAYLSTYSIAVSKRTPAADTALRLKAVEPILAILNPIELHRPTSAFSAQGLNRTLSGAVEAAYHTGSKLVVAECPSLTNDPGTATHPSLSPQRTVNNQSSNPWSEEVSILNATTKRLGELSVGRTVKARTIAERWFKFESVPDAKQF